MIVLKATRVQFSQSDFSCTALRLMLIVHFHAGWNAPAVVCDADGVVGMDGDHNIVAVTSQGFIDRVIHHFKHQMVQTRTVRRVADVHAWALTNRF